MRNIDSRTRSLRFDSCVFLFHSFSAVTFATQSDLKRSRSNIMTVTGWPSCHARRDDEQRRNIQRKRCMFRHHHGWMLLLDSCRMIPIPLWDFMRVPNTIPANGCTETMLPRLCSRLSELRGFSAKVVAKVLKRGQSLRPRAGKQHRLRALSGLRPRLALTALRWRLRCRSPRR